MEYALFCTPNLADDFPACPAPTIHVQTKSLTISYLCSVIPWIAQPSYFGAANALFLGNKEAANSAP